MQNRHSGISTVKRWKANLGDGKKKILYFIGSWHQAGVGICEF